jgi:hypothetical protein
VTAAEIAALLDRPVSDVDGATIVVNAGPAIQDASFLLQGRGLALDIDVDAEGMLVRFDVDLSTAAGDFPKEASSWIVRPSMYLIDVEAGPAAGVLLTGPGQLASGGPASLTAQVLDGNGRRVQRPYSVRFVDSQGNEVGALDSEGAAAFMQYVPEPSTPQIAQTELTTITSEGKEGPGLEVLGTGFSRNAEVTLDGTALVEGETFQVLTPESILILFPSTLVPGEHALLVVNPPGDSSNEVRFTLSGQK